MAEFLTTETLSIFISRPADHVYDQMVRPHRADSARNVSWGSDGENLVLKSSDGGSAVYPLFDRDRLVLDEIIAVEPYDEMLVAQRLVPNGFGCEFIATIFQPERMADSAFRDVAAGMEQAMRTLKRMMEMQGRFEDRPMRSRTQSITLDRDPSSVFEFVSRISSLPQWAMQFIKSMSRPPGGDWSAPPKGNVRVRLHNHLPAGIADQHIIPEPGVDILVPLRVLPNNAGSEITVTIFRPHGMPDHIFDKMAAMLGRELEVLRDLLKQRGFEKAA